MPQSSWRRRRRKPAAAELVVPVASPQRQLHALRVTIKPHDWTREAIRHRLAVDGAQGAEQAWRPEWASVLQDAAGAAAGRLGIELSVKTLSDPDDGAHLRIDFRADTPESLRQAVAVVCSKRLAATWLVLGDLALLGGRFYRRERGYRLHLRPARDVHLPRAVRAAVRDLLRSGSDVGEQHADQPAEHRGQHPGDE